MLPSLQNFAEYGTVRSFTDDWHLLAINDESLEFHRLILIDTKEEKAIQLQASLPAN